MEQIKDTVEQFLKSLKAKNEKNAKDDPERALKKILSRKELKHMQFNYFKKGVLGIKVDSSTWLYYLNLQKQQLLRDISRESPIIKDIRFRLGVIEK